MANHYRYIIFYKPYGVLSQFTQETPKHRTLKEYSAIRSLEMSIYVQG